MRAVRRGSISQSSPQLTTRVRVGHAKHEVAVGVIQHGGRPCRWVVGAAGVEDEEGTRRSKRATTPNVRRTELAA